MRKINKNIVSLFFCVIVSIGMWSYVTYVENPDMTRWIKNVSVSVSGVEQLEEKGYSIAEVSHDKIDVKVRAKRNQFKYLSADSITASADVSRISRLGDAVINVSVSLPASTPNATVIDRRRNSITFTVDSLTEKTFEIEINVAKQPQNGCIVHSISYDDTNSVTVSGAEKAVESVASVSTAPIDLSDADSNIIYPASLVAYDSSGKEVSGVTIDKERVNITFELYKTKKVPIKLNLRGLPQSVSAELASAEAEIIGPVALIDTIGEVQTKTVDASNAVSGASVFTSLDLPAPVALTDGQSGSFEVRFSASASAFYAAGGQ